MTAVGASVPRSDAEAKVRGEADYGVDVALPGMVHARLLRSPVPAGRIASIDVSEARAVPGVHAVVVGSEVANERTGIVLMDQPLFATDHVVYEGEPIAAVVADTPARQYRGAGRATGRSRDRRGGAGGYSRGGGCSRRPPRAP